MTGKISLLKIKSGAIGDKEVYIFKRDDRYILINAILMIEGENDLVVFIKQLIAQEEKYGEVSIVNCVKQMQETVDISTVSSYNICEFEKFKELIMVFPEYFL